MTNAKEINAPKRLIKELKIQCLPRCLNQCTIIPDCDRVKGTKTPTAYNGIKELVEPLKIKIKAIAPIAKAIIPLEYPNRSPLSMNCRGTNLSLARLYAKIGKAENPVLAATARIIAVASCNR